MNIIILGDKFQRGLKSKGCAALLRAGTTETLLELQIKNIRKIYSDADITYIYGFDSQKFLSFIDSKNLNVKTVFNKNFDRYNEAYSLRVALDNVENVSDALLFNGYILPSYKMFKTLDQKQSKVFIHTSLKGRLGCIINNEKIEHIFFGLNNYLQDMYYIQKHDLEKIKNICSAEGNRNCFLFEIINLAIDKGCTFYSHNITKNIHNEKKYYYSSYIR